MERDDRPAAGAHRALPRHSPTSSPASTLRARARPAAVDQGRRAQHRRAGGLRRRPDARHVADARRLGRSRRRAIARAQAGCLLGDVDAETQLHGLAAVLGFVSATGVAGLTLGGGFGYLYAPLRLDHRQPALDGARDRRREVVRASRAREPGPVLGPVRRRRQLRRRHQLRIPAPSRSGPQIVGGAIAWRGEEAAGVLEMFHRAVVANAPPRAHLRRRCCACAPPAPWIAKEVHGKPIVALFVCHSGSPADGGRLLAPIKAFGSPVGDIVQRAAVRRRSRALLDATQPKGRRYYWKSEYLPDIDGAVAVAQAIAARGADRLAALRDLCLPARRRCERAARGSLGGRQPRRRRRPQYRGRLGARRRRRRRTSSGHARPGATCGGSPPAAPTSTSSPKRKASDRTRAAYGSNYPRLARG